MQSDARDETIRKLEREIAEQRAAAQSLREALDAATFKAETLEKSYAKQLAEARDKRASLEADLQDKEQILAGLGGRHEHTLRELSDAVAVIKVLKNERDQLRKQIAQGGLRQAPDRPTRTPAAVEDSGDGTINALIANAGWGEKKPSVGEGHLSAKVAEQETPHEEMLAPDLVFTNKDREQDDER